MVIPVLALTILAPLGMLLPADTGEKMGLQMTLLLSLVVFIQLMQGEMPVWEDYGETPKDLVDLMAIFNIVIHNGRLLYYINLSDAPFDPSKDFGLFRSSACSFDIVYFYLCMDLVSSPYDR